MKSRKLIIGILTILGAWAFGTNSAHATTWYVRDGGGNASQCAGTTNAVYSGSGTNQPCAFNTPRIPLGYCTGNESRGGFPSCQVAGKMASGDTLYIVGDSDKNPGAQALFEAGYDDQGLGQTPSCSAGSAFDCDLGAPPAGISATQPTSIIGIGTHKPQLWADEGQWYVLYLVNGNLDIENLEVTQHSSCNNVGIYGGNPGYGIYPSSCGGTDGGYPFGPSVAAAGWGKYGVYMSGTNLTTKNNWWHNFGNNIIYFPGNLQNWNSTGDKFDAAGQALDDGGTMTFSGNNTLTNDVFAFGGCMEKYPLPDPGNVKDLNNYVNCVDQGTGPGAGGLGGGFMMQNDGNAACGNWTVTGTQFLFNLKTNWDFLHCDGTGSVNIYRSRSEGSSGEALKLNVATANIEESQLIANAAVWSTAPFQAIKLPLNVSGGANQYQICRGDNGIVAASVSGSVFNFVNDDMSSTCTTVIGLSGSNSCSPNPTFNIKNSKIIDGYAYDLSSSSPGFVDTFFNSSSCSATINEDYNSITNADGSTMVRDPQHCAGAHDLCNTNPQLLGSPFGSDLGPTNYYSSTSLGDQFYLQSSSPLIGKGTSSVTYANGSSNDYNNIAPSSPPDIGAIQHNSCIATSNFCSVNAQCCGGTCSSEGQCGTGTVSPKPVVNITSPTSGISLTTGTNVTITANASETSGNITNISLYNGSALLASSSASPYTYMMNNAAAGVYSLTAKATDAKGVSTTSSSVTMTVVNASILPSTPVVTITAPSSGSSFAAGSNVTITTTASETNGSISKIALYNGSGILLGSSSASTYNYVYTNILAGTYTFYAIATDPNGVSTTSSTTSITVTAPSSSPVVTVTSPTNGASFTPGSITLTATASETNGTITQVRFFNGTVPLSYVGTSSPYSYTWKNVQPSTYTITAQATDSKGVVVTSAPVTFVVSATSSPATPVVAITSPTNGSSITAGSSLSIAASASETGGTISQVQFYNGTTLLNTDTTSPYNFTWTNVAAGTYSLTAKATDSNGVTVTSSPVSVTVSSALPVISITAPSNNAVYTGPVNITLSATASEANGTITQVRFFNGTVPLSYVGTSSPYSYTWKNVKSSTYTLTAQATDSKGVVVTSAPITITVH